MPEDIKAIYTKVLDKQRKLLLEKNKKKQDIDEELIHKTINQLKQDTWLELNENLTALEQVNVLNRIFFEIHDYQQFFYIN